LVIQNYTGRRRRYSHFKKGLKGEKKEIVTKVAGCSDEKK